MPHAQPVTPTQSLGLLAVSGTPIHLIAIGWQECIHGVPEVTEALGGLYVGVCPNGRHHRRHLQPGSKKQTVHL